MWHVSTCYKYSITCQDDLLTVDNAQSHVTAFRPISASARSWSDDNWLRRALDCFLVFAVGRCTVYYCVVNLWRYDRSVCVRSDSRPNRKRSFQLGKKHGSVRLALRFSTATPLTISVIAYAEFDNLLEIDRDRNLLVDSGVWKWTANKLNDYVTLDSSTAFSVRIRCQRRPDF